jgi:hypothetical protein
VIPDINNFLDRIEIKVNQIINLNLTLTDQIADFKKQIELSTQMIEDQKKLIRELEDKNKNLLIAKSIKPEEDKKEVKKRIDELVREIDKCTGLLNN